MMLLAALHQLFAALPVLLLTLVGLFLLPNQEEEKAGHRTMRCLGQLGVVGLGLLLATLMLLLRNAPLGAGLLILPAVFVTAVVWSVDRRYARLTVVMAVSLKGKARLAGFLFMLFVPALLFGALALPWHFS
jgi:hypothetical protein